MKKWLKLLLVVGIFAIFSLIALLILRLAGFADIHTIKNIVNSSGKFGIIVFCTIMTLALIFLCFVPILDSTLVVLSIVLFGPLKTFMVCAVANFISSSLLFFVGDKFGEDLAAKLVGREELLKTQDLIDHKSKFLLPVLFIVPGIPDEALCLVAGMTKMKYWYLITISMIYHICEAALFCFLGGGIIDWSSVSMIEWGLIINIVAIDVYLLFKVEKYLESKPKK